MFIDKSQACLTTSSHNDSQVGHCRSGQSPWQAMAAQALSWVAWVIQGIQAPWHWQRLRPPPPGGGLASIWGRPSQPWPCLWSLRSVRVLSRVAEISMGLISGPWHSLSLSRVSRRSESAWALSSRLTIITDDGLVSPSRVACAWLAVS